MFTVDQQALPTYLAFTSVHRARFKAIVVCPQATSVFWNGVIAVDRDGLMKVLQPFYGSVKVFESCWVKTGTTPLDHHSAAC